LLRIALGELADAMRVSWGGFYQKTGGRWIYLLDPTGGLYRCWLYLHVASTRNAA